MGEGQEWVSTNGDTDAEHAEVREGIRRLHAERGRLLAVVEVRVYEHAQLPQLSFPEEALLRPDAGEKQIAEVVRRARQELERWK